MKQTAVEWFAKQVLNERKLGFISNEKYNKLLEQAKEMEKEQIIDAFGVGCQVESTRLIGYQDIADDYYNETFKPE